MEKEKLLEVNNLEVQYKTDEGIVRAVNNISFSLNKGETLGLVGETGAGKTTTGLSILRLLPERTSEIVNGEILFKGENLLELDKHQMRSVRGQQISMIFQDPMTSLNPVYTVGAQIEESIFLHNRDLTNPQIKEKADEMLRLVGITPERRDDYPHQFSGGMKQRVVIAMALACNPELVIADEPTTALDVTIQAQVLRMMDNLKKEYGTSMIMVTHDFGVVAKTCDKVAVVYAGEIIESGTVQDIFNDDKHHPYTKGLFDSLPNMNENATRLKPIAGLMPDPMDLPEGCKFHTRCPYCTDRCRTELPNDIDFDGHMIKCHLFEKEV
ncbi:MAG: ABC transporter ATP-binding protein [Firmicutes bacterium]|nr:ABC transporter ATP-binding protein [Bacillota bacterium]